MRTLSDAKDIRARLLKRVQVEQPDAVEEQVIPIKYHTNVIIIPEKYNTIKYNILIIFNM